MYAWYGLINNEALLALSLQVFAAHPQVVRVAAPATAPAPAPVVRVAAAPAQAAGVTQVRFSSPTAQYDY